MKAFLILADGTVFEGSSIGATGSTIGETVFTTGMTGYLETLTDPSYYGQIVTQTFPLIGNYGVIPEDYESRKSFVRGYVVRELCDQPSNFRCSGPLNDFLKAQGIIGICGIDTRALTKRLRESGVMNGMIVSGKSAENLRPQDLLEKIKNYKITDAVKIVNIRSNGESVKNQAERVGLGLTTETDSSSDNNVVSIRPSDYSTTGDTDTSDYKFETTDDFLTDLEAAEAKGRHPELDSGSKSTGTRNILIITSVTLAAALAAGIIIYGKKKREGEK